MEILDSGSSCTFRKTQITDIVSDKNEMYKAWVEDGNDERKRTKARKSEASVIGNEPLVWFSPKFGQKICCLFRDTGIG